MDFQSNDAAVLNSIKKFYHPRISIIIPFYNSGEFIKETVDSVLLQTFSDFEIIIINDGSNEVNSSVLKQFIDSRITVIEIDNAGVCAARNIGFKHSQGEYILFLDADDKIASDYLSEAVHILDSRPGVKVVSCNVELFGVKSGSYDLPQFSIEKLIARNILVISCLIRSEDYRKTGGFNIKMNNGLEDWDFWMSLLESGGEVYRIDKVCFYYRIRRTSRNHTIQSDNMRALRKQVYLNHKPLYSSHFLDPQETFEFLELQKSKEYRIGRIICIPLRFLHKLIIKLQF